MANYSYRLQPLLRSDNELIQVRMKGTSPEAHAVAILAYFGFSVADEDTFEVKYGYDLRQNFVDSHRENDNPASHQAVGKGFYDVRIPLPRDLVAQIKSIKNPVSSYLAGASGNSNVGLADLGHPTPVPKNATPAEREFYRGIDLFRTELMNFGSRMDLTGDVRTDYLKTIRFAANEFVDLVKSGHISYEEGARRANGLRNVIFEMSRRTDSELFRAYAQLIKPKPKLFEWFLEHYSKEVFKKGFSALTTEAQRNRVYYEVILAAGRDNKAVSGITPYLGTAGKVCLVASIAISVYTIATAEDKVNAAGKEGSSILGGIAGGAAGGAAAGLLCGPGAPVCSGIGIFVGGAVGAYIAAGGYDWLTSK